MISERKLNESVRGLSVRLITGAEWVMSANETHLFPIITADLYLFAQTCRAAQKKLADLQAHDCVELRHIVSL